MLSWKQFYENYHFTSKNYVNNIKFMKRMILNSINRCQSNKISSKNVIIIILVCCCILFNLSFYTSSVVSLATNLSFPFFSNSHSAYFTRKKREFNEIFFFMQLPSIHDWLFMTLIFLTIIIVRWWRHRSSFFFAIFFFLKKGWMH